MSLIKNYRWNSVFFKYFKKITFTISIPCCIIGLLLFLYYNSVITKETNTQLNQSLNKVVEISNNLFDDINRCYALLTTGSNTVFFLTNSNRTMNNFEISNAVSDINTRMENLSVSSPYIDSIYLYSIRNDYVLSSRYSNSIENFDDLTWYETYKKTSIPEFVQSDVIDIGQMVIHVSYGVYINGALYGLAVFNIDANYLEEVLISDNSSLKMLYFIDSEGEIVYESQNSESFKLTDKILDTCLSQPSTYQKSKDKTILSYALNTHNLKAVTVNGFGHLNKTAGTMILIAAMILLVLFLPAILAFYISMQFYDSITELIKQFQNVDTDNTEGDKDEIVLITKNIMKLINSNMKKGFELKEKNIALKKSQTHAMQNQINPHFIFNTLNLINMIIINIVHGENEAELVISNLSDMLYYTFKNNDFLTTLREEINHIKKYIEIENIKHRNNFDLEWNIDEETLGIKTIKLILQPIVENAFEHGINLLTDRRGKISVGSFTTDKNLIVTIEDNGAGIPPDLLLDIQANLSENKLPGSDHIGLQNVNQRIKLIFGEEYGISIDSNEEGAAVTITTPLEY